LTKSSRDKAIYRGQGSIAMTGAARIVVTMGTSPDDPDTRIVATTKNNISRWFKSFSLRIDSLPDTIKRQNRSILVWGEQVDWDSDDIISVPPAKNNDKKVAIEWLKNTLIEKSYEVNAIYKMAEARGLSKTTLNRAATELGIMKKQKGFGKKKTSWWLIDQKSAAD